MAGEHQRRQHVHQHIGRTSSPYTFAPAPRSRATFTAAFSNALGTVYSAAARLTVNAAPSPCPSPCPPCCTTGSLLVNSDNDDPHGVPDGDTLEHTVAGQEPGKYIAVQANDAGGIPLTDTSFVPMEVEVSGFKCGVTKIRFVANEIDLNGKTYPTPRSSRCTRRPGVQRVEQHPLLQPQQPEHVGGVRCRYGKLASSKGFCSCHFCLCCGKPLTIYVQALQEGTANIELQIDPQGNGDWTTVSTVVFTALDTNVGSPNGVNVTPAGYLTIINDVLGVGSDVYMNSAQQANTQLTPNPTNAAIGLPATWC